MQPGVQSVTDRSLRAGLGRAGGIGPEFLRYAVVGGLAFVVDAGTLFLLTALAGVPYLASAAAGFMLGLIVNYAFSRGWVFRCRRLSSTAAEFTIFALIGVVGLGLNELLIWFFTEKAGLYYMLSKCGAAAFVLIWSFSARRWALFGEAGLARPAAAARTLPLGRWWPRTELAAAFAAYFAITVGLQWAGMAYRYPMMQYPDESAHYVTGILVHDFLLQPTAHPMDFARQFYHHYPRVSLIHWPPMLYIVEGAWMVPFGTSTASALALMAALAAAIAILLHREASRRFGPPFGPLAGLLFVSLGITQWQAGMIMMEMLLALLSLGACLALASYLRTDRLRDSLLFGVLAAAAILTRGDGFFLAPVPLFAVLLMGRPARLWERRLWAAALVAAPLCVPYTAATYRVASVGWHQQAYSLAFVQEALPKSGTVLLHDFGAVGLALLALGIAWLLAHRAEADPVWIVLVSFMASAFLLENLVPAGIEPRKLFVLVPPSVLMMVGGARTLGQRIWKTRPALAALGILLAAGAASGFQIFVPPQRPSSHLPELAEQITGRPRLNDQAVLVSAGWREGVFVGEMAAIDHRPAHYVLRATKHLMLPCGDTGEPCRPRYGTPEAVLKFLDDVPVSAVVIELDSQMRSEETSLLTALNSAPLVWRAEPLPVGGGARTAWLYTRRRPLPWSVPRFHTGIGEKLERIRW